MERRKKQAYLSKSISIWKLFIKYEYVSKELLFSTNTMMYDNAEENIIEKEKNGNTCQF